MEEIIVNSNLESLSPEECLTINGGGEWWIWLGKKIKQFEILCEKIQEANLEAPVSVATWN